MAFSLWIETEHIDDVIDDVCNVLVTLDDGTKLALNVWTFDFFSTLRTNPDLSPTPEQDEVYLLPPDLFVRDLSRPTLEQAIGEILAHGRTPERWRIES